MNGFPPHSPQIFYLRSQIGASSDHSPSDWHTLVCAPESKIKRGSQKYSADPPTKLLVMKMRPFIGAGREPQLVMAVKKSFNSANTSCYDHFPVACSNPSCIITLIEHSLARYCQITLITLSIENCLRSHVGASSDQEPLSRHVLVLLPTKSNPWLQKYSATPPRSVTGVQTVPSTGSGRGPQSAIAVVPKTKKKKTPHHGYCNSCQKA